MGPEPELQIADSDQTPSSRVRNQKPWQHRRPPAWNPGSSTEPLGWVSLQIAADYTVSGRHASQSGQETAPWRSVLSSLSLAHGKPGASFSCVFHCFCSLMFLGSLTVLLET